MLKLNRNTMFETASAQSKNVGTVVYLVFYLLNFSNLCSIQTTGVLGLISNSSTAAYVICVKNDYKFSTISSFL